MLVVMRVHYQVLQNDTKITRSIFCEKHRQEQIIIRQVEFVRAFLSIRGTNILPEKASYIAFCTQMTSLNRVNLPHICQVSTGACGKYDD